MIIIYGHKNKGKTTQIKNIIAKLIAKNKTIGGFYSEKIIRNNQVIAYDLVTITDNKTTPFLTRHSVDQKNKIGYFFIDELALYKAKNEINQSMLKNVDYIIIDEVGKLELDGKGWFDSINKLKIGFKNEIIFCVRTEFVKEVVEKFKLKNVTLISVSEVLKIDKILNK